MRNYSYPLLTTAEQRVDVLNTVNASNAFEILQYTYIDDSMQERLKQEIKAIEEQGRNVGFVLLDLKTGNGVSYNANKMFYGASTVKGVYLASLVEKDPNICLYEQEDFKKIIIYSDNDLYVAMRRKYGIKPLIEYCKKCDVDPYYIKHTFTDTTPLDLAKFYVHMYDLFQKNDTTQVFASYFETPNYSLLYDKESLISTRSKAGWINEGGRYNATDDAGIVYSYNHPYVLTIMSDVPTNFTILKPLTNTLKEVHESMETVTFEPPISIPEIVEMLGFQETTKNFKNTK